MMNSDLKSTPAHVEMDIRVRKMCVVMFSRQLKPPYTEYRNLNQDLRSTQNLKHLAPGLCL